MSSDTRKHTRTIGQMRRIGRGWGYLAVAGTLAGIALAPAPALAQASPDEIVERALAAAPPQMRDRASVIGPEGTVLKQGDGGFTCMLTPEVPTGSAAMCADETWLPWADAWVNEKPYTAPERLGIAYMLAGDTPQGGASNIDPFAQMPTADNQWVVEGPHLMLIVPDETLLAGIPTDPDTGGPYVMWKGTPFAHVMVPVAERPEQRDVAEN